MYLKITEHIFTGKIMKRFSFAEIQNFFSEGERNQIARKVLELKNFFDKSNLTELKDLEFQVKNEFKVTLDDEEQGENLELVPQ